MERKFILANGIKIHYLFREGEGMPIFLLHGLTANAYSFGSILKIDHVKNPIFSIDLRGRGDSDKPLHGYKMHDHAEDILALMKELKIDKAILGGHSFGALLSIYIAYHYPTQVKKLILIDAAARMHPNTKEMIAPSMSRLTKLWPSQEEYLHSIRQAPYLMGAWDEDIINYYKADIERNDDTTVKTKSNIQNITEAVTDVFDIGLQWLDFIKLVEHEAILINGTDLYSHNAAILPKEFAMETVNMMKNCHYVHVPGNHLTMLFGKGAIKIADAINTFINNTKLK